MCVYTAGSYFYVIMYVHMYFARIRGDSWLRRCNKIDIHLYSSQFLHCDKIFIITELRML